MDMRIIITIGLVLFTTLLSGCGFDNQAPETAQQLWQTLEASPYTDWTPVPGFETPQLAKQPFHDFFDQRPLAVTISMNQIAAQAAQQAGSDATWPIGSIFLKHAYQGDDHKAVVAMWKRKDGWFWAQWTPDGNTTHSGAPESCVTCHTKHKQADYVVTIQRPK
jgi:hypothetical protein